MTTVPLDECQYVLPSRLSRHIFVVVSFVSLHIPAISLYCSHCKLLTQQQSLSMYRYLCLGNSKLQLLDTIRFRMVKREFPFGNSLKNKVTEMKKPSKNAPGIRICTHVMVGLTCYTYWVEVLRDF